MKFGPRQMTDNVIDIDDLDEKIYRIFSIVRFKEIITHNQLIMVNPSKWDDPFENFLLKTTGTDENGHKVSFENIASKWYGQCWTLNCNSDAMWRIYSPNKDGVRVSTTIRKLFSVLWDDEDEYSGLKHYIGKVRYEPRLKIEEFMHKISFYDIAQGGQNDKFAQLLCIKRPEFEHEREIRLLTDDIDGTKGSDGCYNFQFDYKEVLEEICLDPRLDLHDFNKLKEDFGKLDCTLPVVQSDLYKIELPSIPLVR